MSKGNELAFTAWQSSSMRVDDLAGLERNPKDHDLSAIIESILEFGFVEPPVVNIRTGRLVHGHGRDKALLWLQGHPELLTNREGEWRSGVDHETGLPRGIHVDEDGRWIVNIYAVDVEEGREEALTIALNRTSERGGWNEPQLLEILSELAAQGEEALAGTGYDLEDLERLARDVRLQEYSPETTGFDTTKVAGALESQGESAYLIYVSFRTAEDFARGLAALSFEQSAIRVDEQAFARLDGSRFLDAWEAALAGMEGP